MAMTEREASALLDEAELVEVMQGAIQYIKEVVALCLEAEIPATLDRCRAKS